MTTGRSVAVYFSHTLLMLIFSSLAVATMIYGQEIEAYLWPVVTETKPADAIFRDASKACFTMHLKKSRGGTKPRYEFYAEAHLSPRLPIAIYPSDSRHQKFGQDLVTHPVGTKWDRTFCFEMPATIADNQTVTLYGHAEHDRHGCWLSLSYFKPITVCGLQQDDPPLDVPRQSDPVCDKQRQGFTASP